LAQKKRERAWKIALIGFVGVKKRAGPVEIESITFIDCKKASARFNRLIGSFSASNLMRTVTKGPAWSPKRLSFDINGRQWA
jgi:hypothetical protein